MTRAIKIFVRHKKTPYEGNFPHMESFYVIQMPADVQLIFISPSIVFVNFVINKAISSFDSFRSFLIH
jgi:hypothetical protein